MIPRNSKPSPGAPLRWVALLLLLLAATLTGCKAQACQRMEACCAAVKDHEGVGKACGDMIQGLSEPTQCQAVVDAVQAMFQQRGEALPQACQ